MENNYSSGVLSVLPLFYVGWSDSVLGPSERNLINNTIEKMPHLSVEDKVLLESWTDQMNPPNEEVFRSWLKAIDHYKGDIDVKTKSELVNLGISMAEKSTNKKKEMLYNSQEVVNSIMDLQKTLGIEESLYNKTLFSVLAKAPKEHIETEKSIDPLDIARFLDGDSFELKTNVKNLIRDPFFRNTDIQLKEEYRERVLAQCIELAKQGYSVQPFPKEYGGKNDPKATTIVFDTLAHGDISLLVKFGVQFGLFGGAIHMLGTEKHHKKYLKKLMNLELLGCFAMTETGHGSNVKGLETTAVYDKSTDEFIIHSPTIDAGKEYIGNAMHSTVAAVFAQLYVGDKNHGVHTFIVPLRNDKHEILPGVKVVDNGYKMGLNGVDNGKIWFDSVRIPRENLLNKYGDVDENGNYSSSIKSDSRRFFTMLGALVQGRVSIALASNTASKNALTIAIKYALKRKQFSQSKEGEEILILDYPSHQKRLFPKLAKTYALNFGLRKLQDMFAEKVGTGDMRKVESLAAGLKAMASWHATETIQECREACGGKGYLTENGFTRLKADTDIFTTFEGDNHVLLQLVSKGLLTEFRHSFQDGGFLSIVKHLSARLATSISEQNPLTIRNTSAEHLLDKDFHLAALEYRENSLLFSVASRMRNFIKRRLNPNEIHARVQNHMISLAIASMENFCAIEFYRAIDEEKDLLLKEHMTRLANLYSLSSIYNKRGWYLENDYISGAKSKAIRKQIEFLCREVRPYAEKYVEGFAIPNELLRAEILI